jgi:DNA polymerase-3 subunit beta
MKLLCDRERLREALSVVSSVIPVKSTRPSIENVCLVATDDALELLGTDLEVAIRYRVDDVKVEEPGTVLVPARISSDFVRDLSGETVTLSSKGDKVTITSGSDRCDLATIDPDEFPVVAHFPEEGALKVQGGTFTKLVGRTTFAAAREPGRYAMHGILTLVEDNLLRMVATDGRRLAVGHWPIDTEGVTPKRAIVPTKGMQLFGKVINDPLETIDLYFGENQVGLRTQRAEIFARVIEGEFPRYAAVIPSSVENRVEANAELLSQKVRLVSNVTAADTRAIRLSLSKGQMKISGRSSGTGEASAQMEVDYQGTPGDIAFNPDYLLDGLKNCESDVLILEFNEKTSPGKLTLGENFTYIVMPITVDA